MVFEHSTTFLFTQIEIFEDKSGQFKELDDSYNS